MEIEGYIPDKSFVLQNVDEEEKKQILYEHSEKLAIAFGHANIPPSMPIRVIKNLRVCGDCHNWTKFFSKMTRREVIVRDGRRFHHFIDGYCSCKDYCKNSHTLHTDEEEAHICDKTKGGPKKTNAN
ncbi:hypothetical protein L1049_005072 [Liquidambar formosana]|uniref:DYW domain-containing protein n=1 Tax=Liquidambar formosana TaxID=63359 RepID=A0AAP0X149_LIQFO